MNSKQRTILIIGFAFIVGMMLFPPWIFVFDMPATSSGAGDFYPSKSIGHQHSERAAGYHFLFGQHVPSDEAGLAKLFNRQPYELDVPLAQYILIRIDRRSRD
jgi:hypothetical protein